jgi:hypothetical protein
MSDPSDLMDPGTLADALRRPPQTRADGGGRGATGGPSVMDAEIERLTTELDRLLAHIGANVLAEVER